MMKRFRHILIAVAALLTVIAPGITAWADSYVSVSVPYYQIFETDVEDADDTFVYKISPVEEDAPLPEGSQEDAYYWTVKGNIKGTLELRIPFVRPGEYNYKVEAYVPKPVKGYVYEKRIYNIDLAIANAPDGGFVVDDMEIGVSDDKDHKQNQLDLDPSYTEGKKETETKAETAKPADKGKGSTAVKTGDTTPVLLLTAVMGISFFVLILLLFIKRRSREEE